MCQFNWKQLQTNVHFDYHTGLNILANKQICSFISLMRGKQEWVMTFTTNQRTERDTNGDLIAITGDPFDKHL